MPSYLSNGQGINNRLHRSLQLGHTQRKHELCDPIGDQIMRDHIFEDIDPVFGQQNLVNRKRMARIFAGEGFESPAIGPDSHNPKLGQIMRATNPEPGLSSHQFNGVLIGLHIARM